ncbi:MAG: helix-turn-helix transcriptional regulator [Clostridia bacterium]
MAKDRNQKLKILYIARILTEQSDEEHPVNTDEIIRQLKQHGITAECKSIYSDIEALIRFGLDIVCKRGRNGGYYLLSRPFEMAELRLLVDAVYSSRFITQRKSAQLAGKLGGLASRYQAEQLGRDVYVPNRIRTMNESIYYNIDEINTAILADRQLSFDYFDYNVNKEKVYRHNGERYRVSPCTLMWNDEKYYLIAYDAQQEAIKHFRVDKMERIEREDQLREGGDVFATLNLADYSAALFGMFGGERNTATLRVRAALAGVMIDRFGRDVLIVNQNDGWFLMQASVELSPQFYGWLFGFGTDVELIAPERARKMYVSRLHAVAGQYQTE